MPTTPQQSDADRVWNRACSCNETDFAEGDQALAKVILLDSYIHNGGVGHGIEVMGDQLPAALQSYRYFGLNKMADVIENYRPELEAQSNRRYYQFMADENRIDSKFQQMFRDHPERFAPIDQSV